MADDKQLAYAESIYNSHSAYFARMTKVRNAVRMSAELPPLTINGVEYATPPNGRGLSIVMQFRAFASRQPKVVVTPKNNKDKEERRAQDIERWLYGVPRAVSKKKKNPYTDALYNYAEVGRGILYRRFDETLAVQGKFPLTVEAVDPLACALHMGKDGLLAGVIKETYGAEALYKSLVAYREDAETYAKEKPNWSVPRGLRDTANDDPLAQVETLTLLTDEYCCFYVDNEKVYEYELHPKGVPLDVGFGIDLPSSKPEEWGLGLIYPIAGMLDNEWNIINKETIMDLLYGFPFLVYKDESGNLYARHLVPSKDTYGAVSEHQITTPVPNFQGSELLLNKIDQSIEALTISRVSFGEGEDTTSGYQVNLLAEPTKLRIQDQMAEAKAMLERHYGNLLKYVEHYANEETAAKMGAKGKGGLEKYMDSFSTIAAAKGDPLKENQNRVALTSEAVKGYDEQDIDVAILPEPPSDENAKAQRIGLYKEGYPQEWIDKYVAKVENLAELKQMRREQMLRENNELWMKFEIEEARLDLLEQDEKKAKRWADFLEAQGLDAQGNPLGGEDMGSGEPMPQEGMGMDMGGQAQMTPEQMMAMQMQAGGLMPETMGMSSQMLPPAEMGQTPIDPEQAALMAQFGG